MYTKGKWLKQRYDFTAMVPFLNSAENPLALMKFIINSIKKLTV